MTYTISGFPITGRIVGRSQALDQNGRRCYRLYSNGVVYEVSETELEEGPGLSDAGERPSKDQQKPIG